MYNKNKATDKFIILCLFRKKKGELCDYTMK